MLHIHPFNIWIMGVLNNAQILKKGASFLLEFKNFFSPLLVIFSFQLSDFFAQHPVSAMGWHLSSEIRVIVAVLVSVLYTSAHT